MFTLQSQDSDVAFGLSPSDRSEHYIATLQAGSLQASVDVYAYDPRGETFADFFERLARDWQHWGSVEQWSSLEGEIRIEARMDVAGHVSLRVQLFDGAPASWFVEGTVVTEAGQLDRIAGSMRQFARLVYNAG